MSSAWPIAEWWWNVADNLYEFLSQPGVRRDGTRLDSDFYNDGVWVRWQRGKPRKMGGYRAMSQLANGPVRSLMVDSRNAINSAHYFSQWGVQRQVFSPAGSGGGVEDRTPLLNFTPDPRYTWSHGVMTSSTGGSYSALLAACAPDVDQIDSDLGGRLYQGSMADGSPLQMVSDASGPISVSGGVTVLQPFAVVYGSNGLLKNSDANDFSPSGWTPGGSSFANEANVAGTKFVYGAPVRGGGQAPAGLFWAIDALVRMSFVGGTTIWQYDTLSQPTSIMSKKCVVEHDGKFFWPGTDRFLFYNGVVQELPNQMNCNWFFDNLNYAARNKVWGTKIGRWGEIWWFYPRGTSTECDNAVIYNYVENTWYDAEKSRSAGGQVQLFPFPIWAGDEDSQETELLTIGIRLGVSAQTLAGSPTLTFASTTGVVDGWLINADGVPFGTTVLSHTGTTVTMSANATATIPVGQAVGFSSMTSPFVPGDLVTGGTSGATGVVVRSNYTYINVKNVTGTFVAEALTGPHGAVATALGPAVLQQLDTAYQQEVGVDKVVGQDVKAIVSSFASQQFGLAIGTPFARAPQTVDMMTEVHRLDLDFNQVGPLTFNVYGASFGQGETVLLESHTADPANGDTYVEFRTQERILTVEVVSNTIGGFYEQGQVQVRLEPGDERSSKDT